MIPFRRHILSNGLRIIHHYDGSTRMTALNLLYDVGSKDESPSRTGFAHLFEHLMFGGSLHIPDFDTPLQKAGGENNAWTSNDVTNYYTVAPTHNIETAFWLESDRMLSLAFSPESLAVQKQVVIEEFKQRNLNQPYGDSYLLLRPMAYRVHPYRWPTIGCDTSHIAEATLDEVKSFFFAHYAPNNAILSISGSLPFDQAMALCEKWFSPIPRREVAPRHLPQEPVQTEVRRKCVEREVPLDAIFKAYHMVGRLHPDYQACDALSDLLSSGRSSRLYRRLVMEQKLFTEIDASITGEIDPGLFLVKGKLSPGVTLEQGEEAIETELRRICDTPVEQRELDKVVNRFESNDLFSNLHYLNKATNLAYYELLGDAGNIDREVERYRKLTPADIQRIARELFVPGNSSTLWYKSVSSGASF
ncbi:pitrilysin family protein [Barnesiella sp. An55]|uniref:M16 family metallopeptidase n=1 Tax=Barnesiella sp. An55 TaxID=1965646 RepID=UPI000B38D47E|nr:pitrilysin family protein [Barnesiella sp. An55]OUN73647.1 peptidase M16 [Barnesiella sp. An55]HIZ26361.1 insulinase family protein [Candidatus Barnesiella merdipullorum]